MKTLRELLKGVEITHSVGDMDTGASEIEYDSRKVKKGSVFVAIKGLEQDGAVFAHEAIRRGAVAVVTERKTLETKNHIVIITVKDTRKALALLSANFFEQPSKRLKIIGVTGTNGKTTTSFIIDSILTSAGKKGGLIGTVNYRLGKKTADATHTTPESSDLQRMFRSMLDNAMGYCVMEVSSHSLSLHRVYGTDFFIGVFTNLTQDHLDFHQTEEQYFEAKLKLFTEYGLKRAVINIDDPYGRLILRQARMETLTVSVKEEADIYAKDTKTSIDGTVFTTVTPKGEMKIHSKLIGFYNVSNILCAVGAAIFFDIPLGNIKDGVESLESVPGRFEKIDEGQNFTVVVDYAHTDDALKNVMQAAKSFAKGRMIVVFGCGGERDKGKRPKMGEVARQYADFTVITSDNPRHEEEMSIIADIEEGMKKTASRGAYCSIPDREKAIEKAIGMAREGDMIIIAGKGHEKFQIYGNTRLNFDDAEVARRMIKKMQKDNL